MKKTINYLLCGIIGLTSFVLGNLLASSQAMAETQDLGAKIYLQETFDSALKGWTAKGLNGATATVKDGVLLIDASTGEQELTFPKLPSADFVLTFESTRLQETAVAGDAVDSFSVKYGIQPNSFGYEVELNVLQKDKNPGFNYYSSGSKPDSDFCGPYDCYGVEYRTVVESDVEKGINRSRIDGITFLGDEIRVNDTHTYTMIRIGKEMQFYIDGDLIFRQLVQNYKDGDLAFRVAKGMIFSFDNVTVYSKQGYAEMLIQSKLIDETILSNEAALGVEVNKIKDYLERYNINVSGLEGGEFYDVAKEVYEEMTAPELTIGEVALTYSVGDVLILPTATAKDYKENSLVVNYEIIFNGKQVKIENGKATLNEEGDYVLRIWTRDVRGVRIEKTYDLTVGGVA